MRISWYPAIYKSSRFITQSTLQNQQPRVCNSRPIYIHKFQILIVRLTHYGWKNVKFERYKWTGYTEYIGSVSGTNRSRNFLLTERGRILPFHKGYYLQRWLEQQVEQYIYFFLSTFKQLIYWFIIDLVRI